MTTNREFWGSLRVRVTTNREFWGTRRPEYRCYTCGAPVGDVEKPNGGTGWMVPKPMITFGDAWSFQQPELLCSSCYSAWLDEEVPTAFLDYDQGMTPEQVEAETIAFREAMGKYFPMSKENE